MSRRRLLAPLGELYEEPAMTFLVGLTGRSAPLGELFQLPERFQTRINDLNLRQVQLNTRNQSLQDMLREKL